MLMKKIAEVKIFLPLAALLLLDGTSYLQKWRKSGILGHIHVVFRELATATFSENCIGKFSPCSMTV